MVVLRSGMVVQTSGVVVQRSDVVVQTSCMVVHRSGMVVHRSGMVVYRSGMVVHRSGMLLQPSPAHVAGCTCLHPYDSSVQQNKPISWALSFFHVVRSTTHWFVLKNIYIIIHMSVCIYILFHNCPQLILL